MIANSTRHDVDLQHQPGQDRPDGGADGDGASSGCRSIVPRSSGGNTDTTMAAPTDCPIELPTAITTRATRSTAMVGASAQAIDPAEEDQPDQVHLDGGRSCRPAGPSASSAR